MVTNIYQIQGETNEPTKSSEKSEPDMGFEPTTLRVLERMLSELQRPTLNL